jgi:hypothetical protein
MKGVLATLACVGVIATLMIVGIRTKLPPPDPDWREHLPQPVPPRSRLWWKIWFGRYAFLVAGIVALRLGATRLGLALAFLFLGVTYAAIAQHVVAVRRYRKAHSLAQHR